MPKRKPTPRIIGLICISAVVVVAAYGLISRNQPATSPTLSPPTLSPPAVEARPDVVLGEPEDLPTLVRQVTPSTFTIECAKGGAQGSGFALDASSLTGYSTGVLLTNVHVIRGCEERGDLIITTAFGQVAGSVLAADPEFDLAIIEAPGTRIPSLRAADRPVVGQWALAVGSAMGYQDSVTPGIVTNWAPRENLITTDATLAPGNSGGRWLTIKAGSSA